MWVWMVDCLQCSSTGDPLRVCHAWNLTKGMSASKAAPDKYLQTQLSMTFRSIAKKTKAAQKNDPSLRWHHLNRLTENFKNIEKIKK